VGGVRLEKTAVVCSMKSGSLIGGAADEPAREAHAEDHRFAGHERDQGQDRVRCGPGLQEGEGGGRRCDGRAEQAERLAHAL
jgi:hypothetical protein